MESQSTSRARERAREVGLRELADAEIFALVLGKSEAFAARLLDELGGLEGMEHALAEHQALGEARALRVAAACELGRRVATSRAPLPWVPDSRAVFEWARGKLTALDHEELWVLALDGQHRARAARRVAVGGLSGLMVSVRDPLRLAIREGASAIIAVHNHPSGDPTPSLEDLRFTEQLCAAADLVGTPLLDHVVVAGDRHRSMLDDGVIPSVRGQVKRVLSERG